MVEIVSDATFNTEVIEAKVPVLVDFWAPWCGPCKIVGPIMEKLSEKTGDKVKVLKLNVDENPISAGNYKITGIPTVMLFRNGVVEKQLVGVQQESVYLDTIKGYNGGNV